MNDDRVPLPDQAARDRFTREANRNFSVIAPAGVGKTRAIVDRVVGMAIHPEHRQHLPSLAVVTYTNKAADEMRQRACHALLAREGGAILMSDFNRIFFGTIHSFCLRLLRVHGYSLGLPTELTLVDDADEPALWAEFFRAFSWDAIRIGLSREQVMACLRHLPVQKALSLARAIPVNGPRRFDPATVATRIGACPRPDFESVRSFVPDPRNRHHVARGQALMRRWQAAYERGEDFLPLPGWDKGGAAFKTCWRESFNALREWLGSAVYAMAEGVAEAYREFRIARGALTYADQIGLVRTLLAHPAMGPALRAEGFRVILDEAQDTDPDQFRVLMELAAAPGTSGPPLPRTGHFCMVGDPQQSIYGNRADLVFYQETRARLKAAGVIEELEFHVTFRCDHAVTTIANRLCPTMLNGSNGQVDYVTLIPRPGAGAGQVIRLPVPAPDHDRRLSVDELASIEAGQLAAWLRARGPAALGAADWSQVAILCARTLWIEPLAGALTAAGVPVQNQSRRGIQGDDPAFAWLTALMVVIAEPDNHYEIVGVLRDIFGLSDAELHDFAHAGSGGPLRRGRRADGTRFQIAHPVESGGSVGEALNRLWKVREDAMRRPLFDAVRSTVEALQLRERLTAIGADAARLDVLLSRAAEMEGLPIEEWARQLRTAYGKTREATPVTPHAIPLISCHAAKGLEWDAVIIPFMFRMMGQRGNDYPCLYANRSTGQPTVAFDKHWIEEDQRQRIQDSITRENQRLLYVAMTRARRTLVLTDDSALFANVKDSFASCLNLESKAPAEWSALALEPIDPGPGRTAATPVPAVIPPPAPFTADEWAGAVRAGDRFPRRILPHALAEPAADAEPEAEHARDPDWESAAGDAARRYGLWWHALMERLDWNAADTWPARFEDEWPTCPNPGRGRTEWERFLVSAAARQLGSPEWSVRVELPFLHPFADGRCVEGVIDLVGHHAASGEWLILDWKTNHIDADRLQELARLYAPQLAPYGAAIRALAGPGAVIRTRIYSTACGDWAETEKV